jgi:conjugative transfer signal peptidase TraF
MKIGLPLGLGAAAAILVALSAAAKAAWPDVVLVNETPSLPKGLYLRVPDRRPSRGAIVAIAQPQSARAYLATLQMPPDVKLLKRIVATAGDEVCREAGTVRWSGGEVRAYERDRRGVPLRSWRGCRRLGDDQLLVLGDTPTSFDSRYFGPVRAASVSGVYVEALRW